MAEFMKIPFYLKKDKSDPVCAVVCFQMTLAYFEIEISLDEVYEISRSLGKRKYTLPWGICLDAAHFGLSACFVSRNPYELNSEGVHDVSRLAPLDYRLRAGLSPFSMWEDSLCS